MARTRRNFARAAKKLDRFGAGAKRIAGSGLRIIGEEIMTDAKASRPGHGVPRDTGTLAGTGAVTGPRRDGTVLLSFGGPAAPYALYQHEVLDLAHTVGEARYLVRAVDRWRPDRTAAWNAQRKQLDDLTRRLRLAA